MSSHPCARADVGTPSAAQTNAAVPAKLAMDRVAEEGRAISFPLHLVGPYPTYTLDNFHQFPIDKRQHGLDEGVLHLRVFARAMNGAVGRQEALIHHVLKLFRHLAVAKTQIIIEALAFGAVLVGPYPTYTLDNFHQFPIDK